MFSHNLAMASECREGTSYYNMVLVTAAWGDLIVFCHLQFVIHVWKSSNDVCTIIKGNIVDFTINFKNSLMIMLLY